VCVIAPEPLTFSGSWMKAVPAAANVGKANFYGLRLSWAFHEQPRMWVFLG
jgi:hypothetical protein